MRAVLLASVLLATLALGEKSAQAQVRVDQRVNPWTGHVHTTAVARNPWTGTVRMRNTVYNPWTGGVATNTVRANPWTGNVRRNAAVYNPWTGWVGGPPGRHWW